MKCPAGHDSTATDYCDVCGVALPSAGPPAGASGADSATAPPADGSGSPDASADALSGSTCPNCAAATATDALFCEACGYDFTTGAMPRRVEPPAGVPDAASGAESAAADANISPALDSAWVAEVWVDPAWYDDQESTDPLPSPGVPLVVPLRNTSILIGRASRSRNITPDIDLSSDTGISRRHAQLTTDGSRWWIEDLGSSNGTYVGGAVDALPTTAVAPGQKQEIGTGDRIYLGAWTRIVIRKAAPGEV